MKIFLATNTSLVYQRIPHALNYPFRLVSYFYFKDAAAGALEALLEYQSQDDAEWIMDSGLFSYMFGSEKGKLTKYDDFKRYADGYVEAMHKWGWKHAIVECDAQRILGPDLTEKLRDEVFRQSGLEVIYVWHIPEGEKGLTELARREKRLALSVPEFRMVAGGSWSGGNKVRPMIIKGLSLIREAKTNPRVHLLGNTENDFMRMPADSCDSSTWMGSGRWGFANYYDLEKRQLSTASIYSPKWRAWRDWCREHYAAEFAALQASYTSESQKVYGDDTACVVIAMWMMMHNVNHTDVDIVTPAINANAVRTLPKHTPASAPTEESLIL